MTSEWPPKEDGGSGPVVGDAPGPREGSVRTVRARREESDPALPEELVPSLAEATKTVFELGTGERDVYRHLVANPSSTTDELARALDRDRSYVNRALSTLLDRGLATRRPRILDEGGHIYYYTARTPEAVRERLHDGIDAWAEAAHDRVDEFLDDAAPADRD